MWRSPFLGGGLENALVVVECKGFIVIVGVFSFLN